VVWLAQDLLSGEKVAIKQFAKTQKNMAAINSAKIEIKILSKLFIGDPDELDVDVEDNNSLSASPPSQTPPV
jgi:hypothetical protein